MPPEPDVCEAAGLPAPLTDVAGPQGGDMASTVMVVVPRGWTAGEEDDAGPVAAPLGLLGDWFGAWVGGGLARMACQQPAVVGFMTMLTYLVRELTRGLEPAEKTETGQMELRVGVVDHLE